MKNISILRSSLTRVTVAGCLVMAYGVFIGSPVTTNFFLKLGATDFQFGLLGGAPLMMYVAQFPGAYIGGRLDRRKPWCLLLAALSRLFYLPIALLPIFLHLEGSKLVGIIIMLVAISSAFGNLIIPPWLTWMSDLVPKRILNRYWGARYGYTMLAWTGAYIAVAVFTWAVRDMSVREAFLVLVSVAVLAGMTDIVLNLRVTEPVHMKNTEINPLRVLIEPLLSRDYRTLLLFWCSFMASVYVGSVFMLVYALKILHMPVWQATIAWCASGLGGFIAARTWGDMADQFGHKPVIRFCNVFKPLICLVFVLVTPGMAFPVLTVTMFFDNMLNAGQNIAVNGYMMKNTPREKRPSFAAATVALAGIAGGLGAIAGGTILRHTGDFAPHLFGRVWNNYQLVFLFSFLLRAPCSLLARRIVEPGSAPMMKMVRELARREPMRTIISPVRGLKSVFPGINIDWSDNVS